MKTSLHLRSGSDRSTVASMTVLLASTALLAIFVAPASAMAQSIPTINPAIQWGLDLIHAPDAWAKGYTGGGITVAVGDTGITADQVPAAFANKIDPRSVNFVLPYPGAPYDPTQISDLASHGTHVSGIIAASSTSNAPGIGYNANIVMLRVLAESESCLAPNADCALLRYPDPTASSLDDFATLQGVQIYNASYGPSTPKGVQNLQNWSIQESDPDQERAAFNAVSKGKIIVAAAGNDRDKNPVAGRNPSGLGLYPFIRPGVNASAGVYDDNGKNYDFSSLLNQTGLIIAVTSVDKNRNIVNYPNMWGHGELVRRRPGRDHRRRE